MKRLHLQETDSTNTYTFRNASELEHFTFVTAERQTAGRGQRGNSWESESGKNVTFSVLLKSENYPAREQFFISEAFSLAVCDALREFGVDAKIKWPNDIYVGDRKICGILIEHAVMGMNIMQTVAGAGINVNQRIFLSDAPNPVSLRQLIGKDTDLERFTECVIECVCKRIDALFMSSDHSMYHEEYMLHLWRSDGYYLYRDGAEGKVFDARIVKIAPLGHITLEDKAGVEHTYAFKEVEFIL
ncbi:MAG: biotin--[acetyl-CoA-carboxylase] ligase [Prevotella sp.]|nr:biotin--[acetyl-CoA-carboxylase] ligase [Bacteroides sp.]MCM1366023.1 biotin--[acetyl-CoA-carboxylase] ligase [Prevotella sp.]MCM1436907.1 biotin--[acetyl-CoA-carboxylase] ligase [Prevotella sp.]